MRIILAILLAASVPVAALACLDFGPDQPAINKVQSSWGPAEHLMAMGDYAQAVERLRATTQFLTSIQSAFIRGCVAEGANSRLAEANGGAVYLSMHAGDLTDATAAAQRALTNYPTRHDCP